MTTTLNQELTKIYDCYSANKLTLTIDKTNAILFSNSKMQSLAVLKSISIFLTQGIFSKELNQENLFAFYDYHNIIIKKLNLALFAINK